MAEKEEGTKKENLDTPKPCKTIGKNSISLPTEEISAVLPKQGSLNPEPTQPKATEKPAPSESTEKKDK